MLTRTGAFGIRHDAVWMSNPATGRIAESARSVASPRGGNEHGVNPVGCEFASPLRIRSLNIAESECAVGFCTRTKRLGPQISYSSMCKPVAHMKDQDLLERITLSPKVMAGKPIIKGTRLTVEYILNLLAHGATTEEILEEYRGVQPEDIQACFLFATRSLGDTDFMH